jgi:hypothetical protein
MVGCLDHLLHCCLEEVVHRGGLGDLIRLLGRDLQDFLVSKKCRQGKDKGKEKICYYCDELGYISWDCKVHAKDFLKGMVKNKGETSNITVNGTSVKEEDCVEIFKISSYTVTVI